jgi:hypothetical protein
MTALRLLVSPSSLALLAAATIGYAGYSMFRSRIPQLPLPGPRKQDPEQLDKMLDTALEDSMAASDPPSTVRPEVHN